MKNFHIAFYGCHLYRTFVEDLSGVSQSAQDLWESLSKLGNTILPFVGLKELKSNLICYEDNKYTPDPTQEIEEKLLTKNRKKLKLGTISPISDLTIKGTLSPYRLNDVYAVDITLSAQSPVNTEISPSQIKYFNPKGSLLAPNISTSIGQTIWIYAEIEHEDCQEVAEECVRALLAETQFYPEIANNLSNLYAGKLFGSSLFEFKFNDPEDSTKQCHILVSLNNSQYETLKQLEKVNIQLIDFLCSHHKIIYVNQQSKVLYKQMRMRHSNLEKEIIKSPQEIKTIISENNSKKFQHLENILLMTHEKSLEYTQDFSYLRYQYTAIKTNIINYKIALENINDKENQLQSWKNFVNLAEENWQQQIEIDIEYFAPGQDLFQRVIDTISGLLQIKQAEYERASRELLIKSEEDQQKRNQILIDTEQEQKKRDNEAQVLLRRTEEEQKKRDRQLENTIQSLGIGIALGSGAGGILASTYQVSPNFVTNALKFIENFFDIKNKTEVRYNTEIKNDNDLAQNTKVLGFSFGTSIVVGVVFGLLATWFTKWILDFLDRRELSKQEQEQISS